MKKGMLLEIGTEEIPSRFIPQALEGMGETLRRELEVQRVDWGEIKVMGTPRRLAIFAELEERQRSLVKERIGPPKSAAFDIQGRPTKAAMGFAQREGVPVEDLEILETDKGEYLFVRKQEEGGQTHSILSEILPRLITAIPFPKSMRWSGLELRFARPIHWILAIFDGEVVPFTLENLTSAAFTWGHRFLSPDSLEVKGFREYLEGLRQAYVIVDPTERRELVHREVMDAAQKVGGRPLADEDLLEEVTYLVEYPVAVCGSFDDGYLDLPKEVLINALQQHQRYFPVVDAGGKLLPYFVAVSNTKARDMEIVREGNERVLRARLADAQFFFREDQKVPLEEKVEELKGVIFQAKLGTSYEKVMRLRDLAARLAEELAPKDKEVTAKGAYLCKADLVTEMVGEFPQLQGVMGREYALLGGEDPAVAQVIYEHYLPRFAGDELPTTTAGDLVSIADKLDTIIGCFGVGLVPTGTSDPFALRRQVLGIIHIILGKGYPISLQKTISMGLELLKEKVERPPEEIQADVLAFFRGRFVNLLASQGYPGDLVEAVLAVQGDDLVDARARVEALANFRRRPEFEPLAIAFKRVANILKGVDYKREINPSLFETPQEQDLHRQYQEIEGRVSDLIKRGDYEGASVELAKLRAPVDDFFDHVMVMVENEELRQNRLALLGEVAGLFSQLADFSRVGIGDQG
ncbi:MAG: glycine--tRNA ligase subunit beta [Deltaproteobacteria bacterium]|nr:MAG: glycine--tRNA ligase subunit beta [Deltaproteobacteria bacterium]